MHVLKCINLLIHKYIISLFPLRVKTNYLLNIKLTLKSSPQYKFHLYRQSKVCNT